MPRMESAAPSTLNALLVIATALVITVHSVSGCDSLDQWCWKSAYGMTTYYVSNTMHTRADAVQFCQDRNATLVGPSSNALDAFTAVGGTRGWSSAKIANSGFSFVDGPTGDMSLWKPGPSSTFADCFVLRPSSSNEVVESMNCSGSAQAVCQRTVAPSKWVSHPRFSLSYAAYDVELDRPAAVTFCSALGVGADIAYLPQADYEEISGLISSARNTDSRTTLWVGYDPNANGQHGSAWTQMYEYGDFWAPISGLPLTESTVWNLTTNAFNVSLMTGKHAVVCSRFANPESREYCEATSGSGLAYTFLPLRPADGNERFGGVQPSAGVAECNAAGGEMVKFNDLSGLFSCFDNAALYALVTPFYNGAWLDGSSAGIPTSLSSLGTVTDCARTQSMNSTTLGNPTLQECSLKMPSVCQFNVSNATDFNITSSNNITMSSRCAATVEVQLHHGLPSGATYTVCAETPVTGIASAECATFGPSNASATGKVRLTAAGGQSGNTVTVNLVASCTPTNLCDGVAKKEVTVAYANAVDAVVQINRGASRAYPISSLGHSVGEIVSVTFSAPSTGPAGAVVNLTLASGVNSAGCIVTPNAFVTTSSQRSATVNVSCPYAPLDMPASFVLQGANTDGDDEGCALNKASETAGVPFQIVSFRFSRTKVITAVDGATENITYYPFGRANIFPLTFSQPPSDFPGSFVCLRMTSSTDSNVQCAEHCLVPNATSEDLARNLTFTSADVSAIVDFNATFTLFGPAATEYANTTIVLMFIVDTYKMRVSGIETSHYINQTMTVRVETPYPPGSSQLGADISPSLNLTGGATCTDLAVQTSLFGPTDTVSTVAFTPTRDSCITNGRLVVNVIGVLARYFEVEYLMERNYTIYEPERVPLVPQLNNLFIGAPPYNMTYTLPSAFHNESKFFTFDLFIGGRSVSPYVSTSMSVLSFSGSSNVTSITVTLTALRVGAGLGISHNPRSGSTRQFVVPDRVPISVRDRSNVTIDITPSPFMFADAWYNATLTLPMLPLLPGRNVTFGLSHANIECVPVVVSSDSPSLIIVMMYRVTGKTNGTLTVLPYAQGEAADEYRLPRSLELPPLAPQVTLEVTGPIFLLTGQFARMTVTPSAPIRVSDRFVVQAIGSSSLRMLGALRINGISTMERTWTLGTQDPWSFTVSVPGNERPDENANITFRIASYSHGDVLSSEANSTQVANGVSHRIVVRRQGTATSAGWLNAERSLSVDGSYPLYTDREVSTNITVSQAPTVGTSMVVSPRMTTSIEGSVVMSPANLTFTDTGPLTQQIAFRATRSSGGVIFVTFALSGTAVDQYVFRNQSHDPLRVRALDRVPVASALPAQLIANASAVVVRFTVAVPPTAPLNVSVTASNAVDVTPGFVEFNATTTSVDVRMFASGTSFAPVTIRATPPAGQGYSPFLGSLVITEPSNITVTFPSEPIYAGETALLSVNLSAPVVGIGKLVLSARTTNCTDCAVGTAELPPTSGPGTFSTLGVRFRPRTRTSDVYIGVQAFVNTELSTASDQFRYPPIYSGTVAFRRLRNIRVIAFPTPFYVGAEDGIVLGVSALPDDGAWLTVRDTEGLSITTANWQGTADRQADPGNRTLRIKFLVEGSRTVGFTVAASDEQQRLRYLPLEAIDVRAIHRLSANYVGAEQLRTSQVIGEENSQLLYFRLSRSPQPGQQVNVSLQFSSPLGIITRIDPPIHTILSSDTGPQLQRSFRITGLKNGEITSIRLRLSGSLPDELAFTEAPVLIPSLQLLAYRQISFVGERSSAYIDGSSDRTINVSISDTGFFPLTVRLNYSVPGAVVFTPSLLVFPPNGPKWLVVNYTCLVPSIDGAVTITKVSGNEFSDLITGIVTFSIFERIQATIVYEQQVIEPGSVLTLMTDTPTTLFMEVDGLNTAASDSNVVYTLGQRSIGTVPNPSFVDIAPQQLNFSRFARRQSFTILSGSLEPFLFNLTVTSPTESRFAPGYNITINVTVAIRITTDNFPPRVIVGPSNTREFLLRPVIPVPDRTFLQLITEVDCTSPSGVRGTGVMRLTSETSLDWNPGGTTPIRMFVVGVSIGQCVVRVLRAGAERRDVSTYVTERIDVIAPPRIEWSNASREEPYGTLFIPFRQYRSETTRMFVQAFDHFEAPLVDDLNMSVIGPGEPEPTDVSFYMRSNSDTSSEPRGALAQYRAQHPTLVRVRRIIQRRGVVELLFGPCNELLELEGELLTLRATSLAFNGTTPLQSNVSLSVHISKYVANIVPESTSIATTALNGASALTSVAYAAPIAMVPSRVEAYLWLLDCPDDNWKKRQYDQINLFTVTPQDVLFGTYEELGRWLMIAVTNFAAMLGVFFVHGFIVVGRWLQRKKGSTRTMNDTMGRMRFPALSLVIVSALLLQTVNAGFRVILYSPNSDFRVYAALLVLPFLTVVPWIVFRILFNSDSVYTISESKIGWQTFFLSRIMRPDGTWSHPSTSFLGRYGLLFDENRGNVRWYLLFEYGCTVCYAILSAIEPTNHRGCAAKAGAMTSIVAVQMCAAAAWRPFVRSFTNFVFVMAYGFQFIALTIITSELAKRVRNDLLQAGAVGILIAGSVAQLLCGIFFLVFAILKAANDKIRDDDKPDGNQDAAATQDKSERSAPLLALPTATQNRRDSPPGSDEEDLDPDAYRAVEAFERRSRKPRGVFRNEGVGSRIAYSPLARQRLDELEHTLQQPPEPDITTMRYRSGSSDSDSDVPHHVSERTGRGIHTPSAPRTFALPPVEEEEATDAAAAEADDGRTVRRQPMRLAVMEGTPVASTRRGLHRGQHASGPPIDASML